MPPPGYLQGLRELCDRYEVLLVADETITGFGRTGAWWGVDGWGVSPDIATFAKGVTSGMLPFSGLVASGAVAEVFMHGLRERLPHPGATSSGYPLGCAVAAEVIRTIRDEGLLERCVRMGERLAAGLEEIAAGSPHVAEVRGRGLLRGLELVHDRETLAPLAGGSTRLQQAAKERGLMIYSCPTPIGRTLVEAVMLAPPLVVTEADVDAILERLADAVATLGPAARATYYAGG